MVSAVDEISPQHARGPGSPSLTRTDDDRADPAVDGELDALLGPGVIGGLVHKVDRVHQAGPRPAGRVGGDAYSSLPCRRSIRATPPAISSSGQSVPLSSQPTQGMKTNRTFDAPEIMVPLQCNVHGWMNAWIGVTSHPYFAVSGEDGTFRISGLPAGTYEIEAWHEKLGTRTMTVTVTDGGSATADFSFAPTA